MKKCILCLCVFLFSVSFADIPKLHLLHINGLNTTKDKSSSNLYSYQKFAKVSPNALWDVIYNPTQSGSEWSWTAGLKGFWDIITQKWFEHETLPSLDEFTQQAMKAQGKDYPAGSEQYKKFQTSLIGQLQDLMLDDGGKNMGTVVDEFHNSVPPQYASVVSLLNPPESADYSNTRDYVILLPHSQGNIYANNLYNYLTQTEHFDNTRISIFGYASPAKIEQGQMMCNASVSNYITSTNDGIIALSRLAFGDANVLSNNITIQKNESENWGHGLSEIYLSDTNSINKLNNFINITSNNCFKELHTRSYIATIPNIIGKIVYDPLSKNIIQASQDQICKLNIESGGSNWQCIPALTSIITSMSPNTLTTDNNGHIYLIGNHNESSFLIKYSPNTGIYGYQYLPAYSNFGGYLRYSNNNVFQFSSYGRVITFDLTNFITSRFAQFVDMYVPDGTPYDVDSNNNIYIAPPMQDYMSTVQVYLQQVGNSSTVNAFASKTSDYKISDLFIYNNMIYLCSGTKLYYLPLDSQINTIWDIMNNGCSQVTGNEQYLFTTYGGNLYKYNL